MFSYSVPGKDPTQHLFRILAISVIGLLSGILCLSLYDPEWLTDRISKPIGAAALTIVVLFAVGAIFFSAKGSMWKLKRTFQFQLTGEKIVQTREGGASVEIPIAHLKSVVEYRGWLVVTGHDQRERITIPFEVEGFEDLKQKLANYCPLEKHEESISVVAFIPLAIAIVAYAVLFTSHRFYIVAAAGFVAILVQGAGYFSLRRIFRTRGILVLHLFACGITILMTIWLVYQRAGIAAFSLR